MLRLGEEKISLPRIPAAVAERKQRTKVDPAIALTAAAAIFGARARPAQRLVKLDAAASSAAAPVIVTVNPMAHVGPKIESEDEPKG
jgi:hypothetical protein